MGNTSSSIKAAQPSEEGLAAEKDIYPHYQVAGSSSPLLSLPAEIRNMIWTHALSDHLIHIATCNDIPDPKVKECKHERPAHQYIQAITKLYPKPTSDIPIQFGTAASFEPQIRRCHESRSVIDNFSLNLLRASRQIYLEATPILYATNAFTFTGPWCYRQWISMRTRRSRAALKTIRIIEEDVYNLHGWFDAIANSQLLRLDTIHLSIGDRLRHCDAEMWAHWTKRVISGLKSAQWIFLPWRARRLQLKILTISLRVFTEKTREEHTEWTQAEEDALKGAVKEIRDAMIAGETPR